MARRTPPRTPPPAAAAGSISPIGIEKLATFRELGTTGLRETGGQVWEEFLPALQGKRAIATWREMAWGDATCAAMLRAIEMLIRRVEWRVEPAKPKAEQEATEAAQSNAEFVDSAFHDMQDTWPDTLASILTFIPYGFALHEECFKRCNGPSRDPRKHSRYSDGKIRWSRLPPRAQETIERWTWDDDGTLIGAVQVAPPDYRTRLLPWNRILLFRTTAEKGNPEGRSVLRGSYSSYYYKKRMQEIEGIGVERDLAGLPTALVPPELLAPNAPPERQQQLRHITELLRNIRRDAKEGVIFPMAYDADGRPMYELKLLSTGGRRQFDTSDIIGRYDNRIAMSVLADFVLMGHEKVGSFALASSKTDLFAVAIGAWLDSITEVFNRFAIPRLLALNGMDIEEPPVLAHGDIETVDLAEVASYVSTLVGAGVFVPTPALEKHLLSNAGLPEPAEGEGLEAKLAEEAEAREAALAAMEAGGGVPPGTPGVPPTMAAPKPKPGDDEEPEPPGKSPGKAVAKWSPDQERDDWGRFAGEGSGTASISQDENVPMGSGAAGAGDFRGVAGAGSDEERAETWNRVADRTPRAFVSEMTAGTGLHTELLGVDQLSPNATKVRFNLFAGPGEEDEFVGAVHRDLTREASGERVIYNELISLTNEHQGKGVAKQLLTNQLALSERLGVTRWDTHSGLGGGGYTWARYGYLPTGDLNGRDGLVSQIGERLEALEDVLEPDVHAAAMGMLGRLAGGDREAVWELSDIKMRDPRSDNPRHTVGRALLAGTNYYASLDLRPGRPVERLRAYLRSGS